MGFVTKKCPHCGHTWESRSSHDYSDHFGSPIRMCYTCGRTYVDDEYIEPALATFESFLPAKTELVLGKGKWVNLLFGCGAVGAGIVLAIEEESGDAIPMLFGIGALLLIPVIRGILAAAKGLSPEDFEDYRKA